LGQIPVFFEHQNGKKPAIAVLQSAALEGFLTSVVGIAGVGVQNI
jgi:hypothetical protein